MDTSKTIEEVEEKLFLQPLSAMVAKLCYFRRLERAWRLIESDFARPDTTLQKAAIVSRANKNHLNVLLRKATGLTFHQLLTRYRVLKAISMMLDKNYSFLEISTEVGFGSLNTFERDFRQLIGVTPRSFKSYHLFGKTR
jgi:two-component system response regulator YesN